MDKRIESFKEDFENWNKLNSIKINSVICWVQSKGMEDGYVLAHFIKIDQKINARPYFKQLMDMADKYDVKLYLQPRPYLNYITNEVVRKKITQDYLKKYFGSFGFVTSGSFWMVRYNKI